MAGAAMTVVPAMAQVANTGFWALHVAAFENVSRSLVNK